jgi:hypothetical protein
VSKQTQTQSDVVSQVSEFLARYLQCSEHQRTVLALWVLHTYCSSAAQVTPYLSIQSASKQSGKTLCLQLLSLLCDNPALTAGFTASNLALRMRLRPVSTVLLDECQATLGTRGRSRAPALRALLASGYHRGLGYTGAVQEYTVFCPKAFAGMGQLPEALADRSIPIILERLEDHPVSEVERDGVQRFHLRWATEEVEPLKQQLHAWAEENLPRLQEMPPYDEEAFPPNFSPRRQDLCEPLLQLADAVGGEWPTRIRQALVTIFAEEAAFDLQPSLQLLAAIRDCFAHHGYPERLSTADLLDWTHALPSGLWDVDDRFSAHKLARLLIPFEIRPRAQRIGSSNPARGYQLEHFREPWKKHLDFEAPQSEIPRKDAGCNTVSDAGIVSVSAQENLDAQPGMGEPPLTSNYPITKLPNYQILREAHASEIVNKDAGCNTVSDAATLSVSAGELKPLTSDYQLTNLPSYQLPGTSLSPAAGPGVARGRKLAVASDPSPMVKRAVKAKSVKKALPGGNEMTTDKSQNVERAASDAFVRLLQLREKLQLNGTLDLSCLADENPPQSLHAALDWVDAHPEWSAGLRYKPALEFVASFQKTLAGLKDRRA